MSTYFLTKLKISLKILMIMTKFLVDKEDIFIMMIIYIFLNIYDLWYYQFIYLIPIQVNTVMFVAINSLNIFRKSMKFIKNVFIFNMYSPIFILELILTITN